jgi:glutamate--cysteine ligase
MATESISVAAPNIPSLDAAVSHVAAGALSSTSSRRVGLELEFHLFHGSAPGRPIVWSDVQSVLGELGALPGDSRVSVEPGGQLELSTPPLTDVASAVAALRGDEQVLARAARDAGLFLVSVGADPVRPSRRLNLAERYNAMERHFDAIGGGAAGRAMMSSTAALQVNLDAGHPSQWAVRLRRMHAVGPALVAMSACSPALAGRASGWRSMRRQAWGQLDPARCGPAVLRDDPADAWASYALAAPVMMVRDGRGGGCRPVVSRMSFADWVKGSHTVARAATFSDLDYHLTTLFPPVRPRGFIELRYLDAVPHRWWPALAAMTVTLLDDEVAADHAEEACLPVSGAWTAAARRGLSDTAISRAAIRCAEIAAQRCPPALRPEVEAFANMVAVGRCPGDRLREAVAQRGPIGLVGEAADAG